MRDGRAMVPSLTIPQINKVDITCREKHQMSREKEADLICMANVHTVINLISPTLSIFLLSPCLKCLVSLPSSV